MFACVRRRLKISLIASNSSKCTVKLGKLKSEARVIFRGPEANTYFLLV